MSLRLQHQEIWSQDADEKVPRLSCPTGRLKSMSRNEEVRLKISGRRSGGSRRVRAEDIKAEPARVSEDMMAIHGGPR